MRCKIILAKKKGRDKTVKKSQKRYISPTWREGPTEPIFIEIFTVVDVPDVITCANFGTEIFRDYDFTGPSGRIFHFSIDFSVGLTIDN